MATAIITKQQSDILGSIFNFVGLLLIMELDELAAKSMSFTVKTAKFNTGLMRGVNNIREMDGNTLLNMLFERKHDETANENENGVRRRRDLELIFGSKVGIKFMMTFCFFIGTVIYLLI